MIKAIKAVSNTTKTIESGKSYAKATQQYYTLKTFQFITKTFAFSLKTLLIGVFCVLSIIFLSVAGALYLGTVMDNMPLACLCIAGALFLMGILVYGFRKKIDSAVLTAVGNSFFE